MKNTEIYNFFNLFWQIVKEFYEPNTSDEYWEHLKIKCDALLEVYSRGGNKPLISFAKKILIAFYDYQYDRLKEKDFN